MWCSCPTLCEPLVHRVQETTKSAVQHWSQRVPELRECRAPRPHEADALEDASESVQGFAGPGCLDEGGKRSANHCFLREFWRRCKLFVGGDRRAIVTADGVGTHVSHHTAKLRGLDVGHGSLGRIGSCNRLTRGRHHLPEGQVILRQHQHIEESLEVWHLVHGQRLDFHVSRQLVFRDARICQSARNANFEAAGVLPVQGKPLVLVFLFLYDEAQSVLRHEVVRGLPEFRTLDAAQDIDDARCYHVDGRCFNTLRESRGILRGRTPRTKAPDCSNIFAVDARMAAIGRGISHEGNEITEVIAQREPLDKSVPLFGVGALAKTLRVAPRQRDEVRLLQTLLLKEPEHMLFENGAKLAMQLEPDVPVLTACVSPSELGGMLRHESIDLPAEAAILEPSKRLLAVVQRLEE
mmetsp:Transcript_66454/g.185214  ORF Transcript_66454/g.185214 Transcript_66454/m.185214 type:complete len:409 (+) Transcript_66454:372-1598(+)